MQRKRGELVPIGEVIADLPGPVQALREASPQALHQTLCGPLSEGGKRRIAETGRTPTSPAE